MKRIVSLIFREVTPADLYNINRRPQKGEGGGSQSYIDIPIGKVSLDKWHSFFDTISPESTNSGPLWTVNINSIGGLGAQEVKIGLRRTASVSIRLQKLHTQTSNRVFAWHPDKSGFPSTPEDASSANDPRIINRAKGIYIFILKSDLNEYWASWMNSEYIFLLSDADPRFHSVSSSAGHISFDPAIELDEDNPDNQFSLRLTNSGELWNSWTQADQHRSRENKIGRNDTSDKDNTDILQLKEDVGNITVWKKERLTQTYNRNQQIVHTLKQLYGKCQITGSRFVFKKQNGEPYLEAHHLIPLGKGGSDNPANLIIVSAHIHRMLHYAEVEGLDLSKISHNKLKIKINGVKHTITWLPKHSQIIADTI